VCSSDLLLLDEASLETIRSFFSQLGSEMTENNAKQAYFPAQAEVLPNPVGTAPGFMMKIAAEAIAAEAKDTATKDMDKDKDNKDNKDKDEDTEDVLIFAMPGVPRELALMLDQQVLPRVVARGSCASVAAGGEKAGGEKEKEEEGEKAKEGRGGRAMRVRLLRTFGLGESTLDAELKGISQVAEAAPGADTSTSVELGFRTSFPDNYLRPVVRAASAAEAEARLESVCREIREILGAVVYGEGDDTLAAVVGGLLVKAGATIATAESCTGGLLAEQITQVAGASQYFAGGVIAYANQVKVAQLGVSQELLDAHGAVSQPVAVAMAEGVRSRFDTNFGVSTTGISGPDGGSEEKPVGLVCVAVARRGAETHVDSFIFPLDRQRHRTLTVQIALDWVRRSLLEIELVSPSLLRRRAAATPSSKSSGASR
jgi:nicotinamide-nucleotide amidase